jgi:uncharacterized protein
MSEQVTVDSLEFARSGKQLRGSFGIAELDRLHDRLSSTDGAVEYELTGYTDENGKPCLHCRVRGALNLICQRCLQPMEWMVDLDSNLVLATSESELAEAEDDPEAPDRLLAQKDMKVQDLVEDEILLGLPLAPRHPEGQCRPSNASEALREGGEAANPFAELAQLKPGKR